MACSYLPDPNAADDFSLLRNYVFDGVGNAALSRLEDSLSGAEKEIATERDRADGLEEQLEAARSDLGEIEQLVRHEWRDKDHNSAFVLATIEQVLDASIQQRVRTRSPRKTP